jgi:hypothetical protein
MQFPVLHGVPVEHLADALPDTASLEERGDDVESAPRCCAADFWLQRPYTANMMPAPPSSEMRESADQTTNCAVGPLSTRGSAGELLCSCSAPR